MIEKPKIKACYHVEPVEGAGVVLLSETDYRVLQGHVERLAPLLTGAQPVEALVDRLRGEIPAAEVYYTLMQLEKKGYLVEGEPVLSSREAAYWEGLDVATGQVADRLRRARVGVATFGEVSAEPLLAALEALHIQAGPGGNRAIVLTSDYLHEGLAALNREALVRGCSYLLVKPVGAVVWIGPLVVPGRTGCWACLAQRLEINRPAETFLRQQRNGTAQALARPVAALPSTQHTALQIVATETAKWIAQGKNEPLEGILVTFDTRTLETRAHTLTRRPQCPCCGEAARDRTPRSLALTSRPKRFTADGGHRIVPPEATLKAYVHHVSPLTGVVRRLERLSDTENPLVHSYAAGHNFASRFEGVGMIGNNVRDISGGKGATGLQAQVSGLCEAVERYSAIYQGDEVTRRSSYRALGDEAVHPNACMHFSQRQYQQRALWNAASTRLAHWVPEPFDEEQEIEWTPVWSLTEQAFKYLPTAYCYYGYPPARSTFCKADSNGNAAGNTVEEAIVQGFMELVERDSVAVWWYNRLRMPAVDLASFDVPYFEELQAYYASIDRALWVLDLTTDLQIPAFVALSRRLDQARKDILFGFGAHFDARLGVLRALTEMNQILPTVLNIEEDDRGRPVHPDALAMVWWQQATLENQPYLVPRTDAPEKGAADYQRRWSDDLLEDVHICSALVEEQGMEVLVLDQTRPDVGLPVVKVIVPGLRHFWPRLGPGRLYEVPVRQGWLEAPRAEQQLNPFPMFF